MNGWGIAIIVMMGINIGTAMAKDGKPKTGTHCFWVVFVSACIDTFIFYKAGLWN